MARYVGPRGVVGLVLVLFALSVTAGLMIDRALRDAGTTGSSFLRPVDLPYAGALVVALTVGVVLALRRPKHPVGWLFIGLAGSIAVSGVLDQYARYGVLVRPDSVPLGEAAAVVSGGLWIIWFVLLALVLHLTPTGRPLPGWWRRAAVGTAWAGGLAYLSHLIWPIDLDPPFQHLVAWELPGANSAAVGALRWILVLATALGLVGAAVSLLVRFRRSTGTERRRLLWLAIGVVPMPVFVALAFYASPAHPGLLALAVGGFAGLVPVAAGLSIAQFHLYDVEHVLSRAVTYLLVSALLAVTFLTVVGVAGQALGGRLGDSSLPAVLATLAAGAVAVPAYRSFQEAVDRRFRRRRYDALRQVQDFLADPGQGTVEEMLQRALGDPTLRVCYPGDGDELWVDSTGHAVVPLMDDLEISRQGRRVARVSYDEAVVEPELAGVVARAAAPELENAMLRARITRQLEEVRESRARIAAAHLSERRRLERNLHDGAQQRLLALALQLRAAQVNGSPDRLLAAVEDGVDELQHAVVELRELASGLHPALLSEHGLRAALEDLAARFPVALDLDGVEGRFPAEVETAAWFLACEAVTNAVKHAGAQSIEVRARAVDGMLTLVIADDGPGGADPRGSGLRGIADRAEAVGGTLAVASGPSGTTVTGALPCGS